ncbi:hypothetical protein [Paenibacillus eucommiae]|uniref:SLH domain-containing protein n=1 Tax=Paenibacillus eucommiae TaxID=1355755 RepID=A0ABS4IXG1_9BACL|nr:hypothetical protein [Paenibacillus eucommiae]MBP1992253.1 hypothetical protein [Paenibacillus eucommiae]
MTRVHASYTKLLVALLLSVSLIFSQQAAFAAQPLASSPADGAAEYKQFLQEKFDISLAGSITKGEFIEAVAKALNYKPSGEAVTFDDLKADSPLFSSAAALYENGILEGPGVQGEQVLTKSVAVSIAVRAAEIKELAYTYPVEKVNSALSHLQVTSSGLSKHVAQELAAAVDTGLLPGEFYNSFKPGSAADEQLVNVLLGKILVTKGLYKKYLGYISDADIYAKLSSAYQTSDIIDAPKLQTLVNTALEQELITGYNIKDSRFEPNFIPSLSLIYGHSNFKHAVQLIGLLRSEGLDAKVQFEPKTSAFIHLAEWGDPGPNVVKIANGNYIAYAKEYDLEFEFSTVADKAAFQNVILTYAKKNVKDQTGLIASSWWQPLYYSSTELKDYEVITNNFITDKDSPYTVNPFSLNEDSAKVVAGLKAIDPDAVITPFQFWVDKPFFNYLHGEAL